MVRIGGVSVRLELDGFISKMFFHDPVSFSQSEIEYNCAIS